MAENKPNTAEQAEKKLTFAELTALPLGDLTAHLKRIVKEETAITKARDVFNAGKKFHAKVVAALKRTYNARLNAREIPPDMTFKAFFEQNAGGSLPGRIETLAVLFNALCLTLDANGKPLLSEENFDAAAVDWLEKANPIVKHAMKEHGENWRTCDDVLDLVNALSKPGDAMARIKEIRERQDGGKKGKETEAVSLTVGRAVEFLKAAIKDASKMPEEAAYALFVDTIALGDLWGKSGIAESTLNAWSEKLDQANAKGVAPHIEIKTAEEAAAVAA